MFKLKLLTAKGLVFAFSNAVRLKPFVARNHWDDSGDSGVVSLVEQSIFDIDLGHRSHFGTSGVWERELYGNYFSRLIDASNFWLLTFAASQWSTAKHSSLWSTFINILWIWIVLNNWGVCLVCVEDHNLLLGCFLQRNCPWLVAATAFSSWVSYLGPQPVIWALSWPKYDFNTRMLKMQRAAPWAKHVKSDHIQNGMCDTLERSIEHGMWRGYIYHVNLQLPPRPPLNRFLTISWNDNADKHSCFKVCCRSVALITLVKPFASREVVPQYSRSNTPSASCSLIDVTLTRWTRPACLNLLE